MTKNTLSDLNNHLFEQLERLNDAGNESLNDEINRSKAVTDVAKNVIDNGKLVLEAEKFRDGKWDADAVVPKMLE